MIQAESNFNALARSPKGAQGLMQLMPQTAMRFGVKDPFQPEANINAGAQYIRELLLRYDGDLTKRWRRTTPVRSGSHATVECRHIAKRAIMLHE